MDNPIRPLTRKDVFNFVSGCGVSAVLGATSLVVFPHMSVLGTVLGLASFGAYYGTMKNLFEGPSREEKPKSPKP